MTVQEIVQKINESQWFHEAASKIGGHLRDDLKQEFILFALEKQPQSLVEAAKQGYERYFTVKVMTRMRNNVNNPFFKTYLGKSPCPEKVEPMTIERVNKEIEEIKKLQCYQKTLNCLSWYEREMFNQFAQHGNSFREINRRTKIDMREISRVINKVKNLIHGCVQINS